MMSQLSAIRVHVYACDPGYIVDQARELRTPVSIDFEIPKKVMKSGVCLHFSYLVFGYRVVQHHSYIEDGCATLST